jgi:hypothetical protein
MQSPQFQTPDDAEAAFYNAFRRTDLGSMGSVWLQGEQSRCVHPGGDLLHGYGAVLESWRSIFAGARMPRIHVRVLDRFDAGTLSIHLIEERIGAAGRDDDLTRVLATNTYLHTADGWRLILHHATLPLVEAKGPSHPHRSEQRVH